MTRPYCSLCQKPQKTCLCSFIRKINNLNDVFIFQHSSEKNHALGTAKILSLSLKKCHLFIGEEFNEKNFLKILPKPNENTYLLFPHNESTELSKLSTANKTNLNLIVLDGTWRKCRLLLHKNSFLKKYPSIYLNPKEPSQYILRKSLDPLGLSTVEAVHQVLSFCETDHFKFLPLLEAFDKMIKSQIEKIPSQIFKKNYKKK